MILRCTQKLLKASGATAEPDPGVPVGVLGEWYANGVSLPFPGRSTVMFTHPGTLLTVVAPGRALRTTLPVFHQRLPGLLRRVGVPEEWISAHAPAGEVRLAKTADRRVLGSMTDFAYAIWYHAQVVSGEMNIDELERELAITPMSYLGHGSPDRAMLKLATSEIP
ncbi:MAG TPA: hypothetical protein VFS20_11425 [Longimicrobium sp.]|nr:hypothetical protein [Longimicrobium sp.]